MEHKANSNHSDSESGFLSSTGRLPTPLSPAEKTLLLNSSLIRASSKVSIGHCLSTIESDMDIRHSSSSVENSIFLQENVSLDDSDKMSKNDSSIDESVSSSPTSTNLEKFTLNYKTAEQLNTMSRNEFLKFQKKLIQLEGECEEIRENMKVSIFYLICRITC